jgi:acetolactate synthase I/II/III large subunit
MKLSDYVIDFLVSEGINHIFEVCGGGLAHLLDSLYDRKDIIAISMHHEMAASIAAEGYARAGGNFGVAMATSGPGATNLITGIGSCFFDSIPCLFITGQVNTYEFKFNKPVRQIGFQETDIVNIVKPLVKKATLLIDENKIKYCLDEAVDLAKSGRPGPVLLDIPLNIQRAEINPKSMAQYHKNTIERKKTLSNHIMSQVIELIDDSSRPIILAGGGVRLSKSQNHLVQFARNNRIPVVTSLMGLDAFPHDDPLFMGMIGTYGNRYANLAIANSDLILALGTRLDTRQTGTKPETFARGAKKIHVDIDPAELNNKVRADLSINSDIRDFLILINEIHLEKHRDKLNPWIKVIKAYKDQYPSFSMRIGENIMPNYFMHKLSTYIPDDALICVDVGQIQMWAAQSLDIKGSQRFLTQGGMASMGSALPMAIGASFARPGKTVVVIAGDGGFQLNIQELQTVYHHNLPIKIILLNNNCYGMVRQFQEQYFNSRFQSTVIGYSTPDFQKVVTAYKIKAAQISKNSEIYSAIKELFADESPGFLEVNIDLASKVMPKLSVNRPIEDQDPPLERDELRSKMIVDVFQEGDIP